MEKKLRPAIKPHHAGCLCCEGMGENLPLDTVLYSRFGGWTVFKNGKYFFSEGSDKEWEENKTLQFIEDQAAKEPDADWTAILDTPLHGEEYQRQDGKWILVAQNEGFA